MAIDTGALYYLVDPFVQWENVNGKPIVGGHVEVYEAGTDNKVITYQNWDGTHHPFKIPLGSDGRACILVDPGYSYDAYVYDSFNNLVCSRLNIIPLSDGDIHIEGMGQVYHDETLSGKGTPNSPLTVISGGKVYGGIYPIDVNNEIDMISADNVPLGVQAPLYFAQDDDEGLVIALSSVPVPEGTMNESAFGYEDGQITSYNGSAFSAGNSYEAGSYVDITNNTISVTGLQPSGEYVTSGDLDEYTKRTDFDAATGSLNSSKLDVDVYSSQSANFLTAHQSLEGYATEQWVENKGYLTAVPDNYATTGDLQAVSGDITAMIPSTAGLATEDFVTSQGYITDDAITGKQDITGMTAYANSAEVTGTAQYGLTTAGWSEITGGGGVTGDFELSAGSGISIVDYPLEQKTVISVTAQGGNPEVEQAVIDNSATWNTVSNKLDTTAFSDVSGTFLTAHQDLSDYQTTAGMTAYQSAGDYLTTADSASFLTTVPDTYLQNTDLATADGKVTAISGIPLSAGGDVPEGVMVESGLEYDNTEISGYSGSAFKDVALTDVVTANSGAWGGSALPVSAGQGVKISLQNDTLVFENDETVLYSGPGTTAAALAEPITNFDSIKVVAFPQEAGSGRCQYFEFPTTNTAYDFTLHIYNQEGTAIVKYFTRYTITDANFVLETAQHWRCLTGSMTAGNNEGPGSNPIVPIKIVGMHHL